jgi:hypothetical protein
LQVVQIQAGFASCAGIYHFETGRYPFPCQSRQNASRRVAMWRGPREWLGTRPSRQAGSNRHRWPSHCGLLAIALRFMRLLDVVLRR